MSAYRREDERAIRVGRLVEDWTRSGLLTTEQRDVLIPQVQVDLRRTNLFLRITLFVFGGLILQSTLGLIAVVIDALADDASAAVLCLVGGGICLWLASRLVGRYQLYRFGVEEAVALSSAGLVAVGAALLVAGEGDWPVVVGLSVAAVMLGVLYRRFGYVYAAILGLAITAALPFQFAPWPGLEAGDAEVVQRVAAVVLLAAAVASLHITRAGLGDDYPGDVLAVIEAAAWLGIYLLVNLVLSSGLTRVDSTTVYWSTYAGIWMLPAAGLWAALRRRERPLLIASLIMTLATLLTNKPYLRSPPHEWDPIVLGVLLMGAALAARRWLASGEGGARFGYTASRLVASDKSRLAGLALVSAAQADVPVATSDAPVEPTIGGGGGSGGAGAGGSF